MLYVGDYSVIYNKKTVLLKPQSLNPTFVHISNLAMNFLFVCLFVVVSFYLLA